MYYTDEVYNFQGILHTGYLNPSEVLDGLSPQQCCEACYNTPSCAVFLTEYGTCNILQTNPGSYPYSNSFCPNGVDTIDIFTGQTPGLPPPITYGTYAFGVGPCFAGGVE